MERTASGLLVPEGATEAAVAAALRRHDDSLRLVPQDSDAFGRRIYKVYQWNGPDREATFLFGWWDANLNPLPLSMAIVDQAQLHDRNTVGRPLDEAEANRQLQEGRRKDYLRDAEAIVQEFGKKVDGKKSAPQPRSRRMYLARSRTRGATNNPEWKP